MTRAGTLVARVHRSRWPILVGTEPHAVAHEAAAPLDTRDAFESRDVGGGTAVGPAAQRTCAIERTAAAFIAQIEELHIRGWNRELDRSQLERLVPALHAALAGERAIACERTNLAELVEPPQLSVASEAGDATGSLEGTQRVLAAAQLHGIADTRKRRRELGVDRVGACDPAIAQQRTERVVFGRVERTKIDDAQRRWWLDRGDRHVVVSGPRGRRGG
jgi:hypothetical protein